MRPFFFSVALSLTVACGDETASRPAASPDAALDDATIEDAETQRDGGPGADAGDAQLQGCGSLGAQALEVTSVAPQDTDPGIHSSR